MKESPFIEQVMLVGAEREYEGALIVPAFANLLYRCRKQNIPDGSNEELCHKQKVNELFKDLIESFNKYFNHVEQVKKFELMPNEWTIDSGEMTPKLSLKKKVVMEKYAGAVDRI